MKRILIILVSLLGAILFAFPTLVLYIAIIVTAYSKWVAGLFTISLAWNLAKLVESIYIEHTEKKNEH
jgi:hypothetical protein